MDSALEIRVLFNSDLDFEITRRYYDRPTSTSILSGPLHNLNQLRNECVLNVANYDN